MSKQQYSDNNAEQKVTAATGAVNTQTPAAEPETKQEEAPANEEKATEAQA